MWTHASEVLAQGGQFGTAGLTEWFKANVIHVLVLIIAAGMLWKSKSGDNRGVMSMAPGLLFGLGVAGIAITNTWEPAARFLAGLVGAGGG